MPILAGASVQDRKRLLELFPVADLRQVWAGIPGNKAEICQAVAEQPNVDAVANFVDAQFSCCRQHVYVFEAVDPDAPAVAFPAALGECEQVTAVHGRALYMLRSVSQVILKDPLEETTLEFLWPVRVEVQTPYVVVSCVMLEKDFGAYFDRPFYVGNRGVDEKDVVGGFSSALSLKPADLHKGIKKLWDEGFMDSPRTKYKKTKSLASETMDEELGIREHNPDLYAVLVDTPLYNTLFAIAADKETSVSVFSADPSKGTLAFPRYSKVGDTDVVIREILQNNL